MKTILTTSFCLIIFSTSIAQNIWQVLFYQTVNPYSIEVSSNGNAFVVFQDSLIRSTDNGQSWEYVCYANTGSCAFGTSPTGVIYFYNYYDSLRKSTDEGNIWITLNLPKTSSLFQDYIPINANKYGDVFVQLNNRPYRDTYRSTDEGSSWESIGPDSSEMIAITFIDDMCIASFTKASLGLKLYRSFNNGDDWEIIPSAPTRINSLFTAKNGKIYGGRVFNGNPPGYLFTSLDSGTTWQAIDGINPGGIYDIVENQLGHLFIATGQGVYRSTDDGNTWHLFNSGLLHTPTWKLAVDSLGYLYASTGLPQMLYGTVATTIPVELVSFIAIQNGDEVHLKWETATELNNLGFEIERRTDKSEWRAIGFEEGKGSTTERQYYSFIDDNISNGKYYYRLKQIDYNGTFEYSKTVEIEVQIINSFSLEQNYPNPFNPATNIKYQIAEDEFVTLKVYDVLGNEVATLVNEEKPTGEYFATLNASNIPSGVYFYRLHAGNFIETRKMVLLK